MTNASATESHPGPPMKIYGKVGCSRAYAIRDFLHRNDVPFEWIELKTDDQCRAIGVEPTEDLRTPVCVFPDGTRLECPTIRQITEKLGWFHDPSRAKYDLAIYGAGPAGLSAAVYGASEGLTYFTSDTADGSGQLVLGIEVVIDFNIEITFVLCIWLVCEIPRHALALLDCEHFAKIEDRLLPVRIFGMGAGGESNWFVAGGKVDVEPGDQSVNKVIPLATKAKGSREGEFSGCNCVEVDCENRTRISN